MSISILERECPCCGTATMLLCFDKLEGGVASGPVVVLLLRGSEALSWAGRSAAYHGGHDGRGRGAAFPPPAF